MTAAGTPFWSGAKRAPSPLSFDINDTLHLEFIQATSNMLAELYGIPITSDLSVFHKVLPTIEVPSFNPTDGITIATTEEEAKAEAQKASSAPMDIDDQCKEIYNSLPSPASLGADFRLKAIEFDKDVDSQMRVIAACSNLRARNYKITEADLHTSRGIAGKITPAIATTTALVTGAICLEIYKLLQDKPVSQFMNSFNNLAIPLFTNMEPNEPKVTTTALKGEEWKWTLWDRIDINKPTLTLTQLLEYLEEEYGLEISMFSSGVTILYSSFMNKKKMDERKNMTMKQVVESITKKEIPPAQKYLIFEMIASDSETGDELELPYVRFALK
jgi:ubiquitin-activating enzyme E1